MNFVRWFGTTNQLLVESQVLPKAICYASLISGEKLGRRRLSWACTWFHLVLEVYVGWSTWQNDCSKTVLGCQIMLIFISKRAKPSELPRLLGKQTVWLRHRGFVRQRKDVSMYPLNNQLSHPDNLSHPWQMNLSFDCSCPVPYDLPILPEHLVGHAVKTCVSAVTRPVKWPTNHLFTSGSAMLYGIFWVEPQMDQWSERLVDSDWLVQLENKQITQWNLTWWSIFKRSLIWITLEEGPASQQCPQVALGEWFWVKPQWWGPIPFRCCCWSGTNEKMECLHASLLLRNSFWAWVKKQTLVPESQLALFKSDIWFVGIIHLFPYSGNGCGGS